jgi:hypothetical protein
MADLNISVQQVGAPLGSLTLAASAKEILATLVNRLTATIELAAFDGSGVPVDFQWSNSASGTYARSMAGTLRLPVVDGQSWFVIEGATPAATLQVRCCG